MSFHIICNSNTNHKSYNFNVDLSSKGICMYCDVIQPNLYRGLKKLQFKLVSRTNQSNMKFKEKKINVKCMMQLFSQYLMWSKKFEIWRKLRSFQTFATTFLKPQNEDFMSLLSWMARVAKKTHVIENFLFYDIKSSKAIITQPKIVYNRFWCVCLAYVIKN
jgi:hypothetical protein